eukprot:6593789-Prymnesium_polylepis.1
MVEPGGVQDVKNRQRIVAQATRNIYRPLLDEIPHLSQCLVPAHDLPAYVGSDSNGSKPASSSPHTNVKHPSPAASRRSAVMPLVLGFSTDCCGNIIVSSPRGVRTSTLNRHAPPSPLSIWHTRPRRRP